MSYAQSDRSTAAPEALRDLELHVARSLVQVDPAEWDRLLDVDDAPLLSWAYLQGLEAAGCVGDGTTWSPAHLLLRKRGRLIAAAPAYLKSDSDGEWVYDLPWAEFAASQGLDYYPKLVLGVPFNPVTGGRLLCPPDLPEPERLHSRTSLLLGAAALCRKAGLSSAHVHFQREQDNAAATAAGFQLRRQEQFHFINDGYATFDEFLSRMRPHRRNTIRRERRALLEAGVTVRTLRGLEAGPDSFTRDQLDATFDMYHGTSVRYTGGPPYLTRAFLHLLAERIGDRLELVLATGPGSDGAGELLGGAINLRGDRRLLGRYWGEARHVPFLHFEVCFYHSIERCIREGLSAFEPGHGGEQKLLRGFQPTPTYSAHCFRDPRLGLPIAAYLRQEAPLMDAAIQAAQERCPLRDLPPPAPLFTVPATLPVTLLTDKDK